MSGIFDEDPREKSRGKGDTDTELTLGAGMLLTVFFGLVLICGLCFGLGYAFGSRGSKGPVFQSQPPAAGPSPQFPAGSQQGKPSAAAQPPAAPPPPIAAGQQAAGPQGTVPGQPPGQVQASEAVPDTAVATAPSAPQAGRLVVTPNDSGWHPVQSAMPGGTAAMPTAQPVSANQAQPSLPAQGSWMVQIAALSSQEDAGVLIAALRRRGYAVSAVRYPSDTLIHVCIGPFGNRIDANSMRQKLLGDGYNAQIVP